MRITIIAVTAMFLAPTAVMASAAGGAGAAAALQDRQIGPSFGDNVILAKGDMSGKGPGVGGQKGQKKGGHKGKQAEGKDNPNKGKGKGNN